MTEKKVVHFGGGAIGRGFIAPVVHASGYEVVFVDVQANVVEALQRLPTYTILEIDESGQNNVTMSGYRALNGKTDEDKVIQEIATAQIVTCAVGPRILEFIAPTIARGIEARYKLRQETSNPQNFPPLAIVACENAINATNTLAGFIVKRLSPDVEKHLTDLVVFANCAVDRIVPKQDGEKLTGELDLKIEKFYEWCIEEPPFRGNPPPIKGVHFVNDLTPYIERKLYTVNTSHAAAAYYGYRLGKTYIEEAMKIPQARECVTGCLDETSTLIIRKHNIDAEAQKEYVTKILARITNPMLKDEVVRVGRAPLRKLSKNERLVGPARQLMNMGVYPKHLLQAIELAFEFQNVKDDEESVKLTEMMKVLQPREIIARVCEIDSHDPLYPQLVDVVEKVQKSEGKL